MRVVFFGSDIRYRLLRLFHTGNSSLKPIFLWQIAWLKISHADDEGRMIQRKRRIHCSLAGGGTQVRKVGDLCKRFINEPLLSLLLVVFSDLCAPPPRKITVNTPLPSYHSSFIILHAISPIMIPDIVGQATRKTIGFSRFQVHSKWFIFNSDIQNKERIVITIWLPPCTSLLPPVIAHKNTFHQSIHIVLLPWQRGIVHGNYRGCLFEHITVSMVTGRYKKMSNCK